MSEVKGSEDRLVEFAAILDQFAAEQRRLGLAETRLQKITAQRSVGQACTIVCELTIPQQADAQEIYNALKPWDDAIDRFKAKSDLADHYFRMLNKTGEIEVALTKMAHDQLQFSGRNRRRNSDRRVAVAYTEQQRVTMENHRTSIRAAFEAIEETRKAAEECRRILGGDDPFRVLEDQINARLDRLRGAMREEAA